MAGDGKSVKGIKQKSENIKQKAVLEAAYAVMSTLEAQGFEAYLVGGAVRDRLLERLIQDADVATNAKPDAVMEVFPSTIPTGLMHGTVTVLQKRIPVQVTTYRLEGGYEDNRRPDQVIFVSSINEDLSRRDFTINAMAEDRSGHMIDPFGGFSDLHRKTIRAVGEPKLRFSEDALRIMRAIRFAAQLDFSIEDATWQALCEQGDLISHVSMERIRDECSKIFVSDINKGLHLLMKSGLFAHLWPDVQADCLLKSEWLQRLPAELPIRTAAFYWITQLDSQKIDSSLRRFRYSKKFLQHVQRVLEVITESNPSTWSSLEWRTYLYRYGQDVVWDACRIAISQRSIDDETDIDTVLAHFEVNFLEKCDEQPIWSIQDLRVTGTDLINQFPKRGTGPWIKHFLVYLAEAVLTGQIRNTKKELLSYLKEKEKEVPLSSVEDSGKNIGST